MKNFFKKLLCLSVLGTIVPCFHTQKINKVTALDSFDGETYLSEIYENYTVTDSMLDSNYLDSITNDDLFVLGNSSSLCACQIDGDGYGLYLSDKQDFNNWIICKLHKDEQASETNSATVFQIELLNPYGGTNYNPCFLNIDEKNKTLNITAEQFSTGANFKLYEKIGDPLSVISLQTNAPIFCKTIEQQGWGTINMASPVWEFDNTKEINDKEKFGFFKIVPAASVTYNPNGAEGYTYSKLTKWHEKIDTCSFSYDKHCFIGWNTQPDGSGRDYLENEDVCLLEDEILYAQWKDNPIYGIDNIKINYSLGFKYTTTPLIDEFNEVTQISQIQHMDDVIIVATYDNKTYAMNNNFVGEEVNVVNNKIIASNNSNIENIYFTADNKYFNSVGFRKNDQLVYFDSTKGFIYTEGTQSLYQVSVLDSGTYFTNDTNNPKHCLLCKLVDDKLVFCISDVENIGQDGWSTACKIFRRTNNPYSNVDFRVRIGLEINNYINTIKQFSAPDFDLEKFTDYGFDLVVDKKYGPSINNKTYSFIDNDLVYQNSSTGIQYINLLYGDCLSFQYRYKLDLQLEVTPYVVYDGMKIKSNNPLSYSIRDLVDINYKNEETKEAFTPLYNTLLTIPYAWEGLE